MTMTRRGKRRHAAFFRTATPFRERTARPTTACVLTSCSEKRKKLHRHVKSMSGFKARKKNTQEVELPTQFANVLARPKTPTAVAPQAVAAALPRLPAKPCAEVLRGMELDTVPISSRQHCGSLRSSDAPMPLLNHVFARQLA